LAAHSAANGHVILSGLLIDQAPDVTAAYVAAGFVLKDHREIGDWATLTLCRKDA